MCSSDSHAMTDDSARCRHSDKAGHRCVLPDGHLLPCVWEKIELSLIESAERERDEWKDRALKAERLLGLFEEES